MYRLTVLPKSFVLVLLALVAPLWAQIDDVGLEQALKNLRGEEWTLDSVTAVVTALQERHHHTAAGWWLAEAEAATVRGTLPKSTKTKLAKLRSSWAKVGQVPPKAKNLSKSLVRQAEGLVRVKGFETARAYLDLADTVLMVWPEKSVVRMRDRVAKKAGDRKDEAPPKRLGPFTKRGEALKAQWQQSLGSWMDTALEEFENWGAPSGYSSISKVSAAMGDGHTERTARLRSACDTLGLDLKLKASLWVMSFKDVDVWVAGKKVGTQPGEMSLLTSQFTGGKVAPAQIEFSLWPGETLAMMLRAPQKIEMPQGLPPMGLSSPDATCVRLELNGKTVPATAWRTGNGETQDDIKPPFRSAFIGKVGPLTGASGSGPVPGIPGRKATKQVKFGNSRQKGTFPVSPAIEDFFSNEKVQGDWILGFERHCFFVLDIRAQR